MKAILLLSIVKPSTERKGENRMIKPGLNACDLKGESVLTGDSSPTKLEIAFSFNTRGANMDPIYKGGFPASSFPWQSSPTLL